MFSVLHMYLAIGSAINPDTKFETSIGKIMLLSTPATNPRKSPNTLLAPTIKAIDTTTPAGDILLQVANKGITFERQGTIAVTASLSTHKARTKLLN